MTFKVATPVIDNLYKAVEAYREQVTEAEYVAMRDAVDDLAQEESTRRSITNQT